VVGLGQSRRRRHLASGGRLGCVELFVALCARARSCTAVPQAATRAGDFRYHFSPLGQSASLFTRLRREGDEAGLATELHVPGPIRQAFFSEDIRTRHALPVVPDFSEFYGLFTEVLGMLLAPAPSLMIFVDGGPVPLADTFDHDLSTWDRPGGNRVAV